MQRQVAIGGLVFVALVVASIFVLPNPPNAHASSARVVTFFQTHKTGASVDSHVILLAVFVGVFFFWYFRDFLGTTAATKRLATIGFAGAILFASSGAVASASFFSLNDAVGHADPSTIQTLNMFQGDFSGGMAAVGVAVFLVATSIAILQRSSSLPQWLGWLGIVLGVASIVFIGLGLPAIGLWLLITCITMLVRSNPSSPDTAHEAPVG